MNILKLKIKDLIIELPHPKLLTTTDVKSCINGNITTGNNNDAQTVIFMLADFIDKIKKTDKKQFENITDFQTKTENITPYYLFSDIAVKYLTFSIDNENQFLAIFDQQY